MRKQRVVFYTNTQTIGGAEQVLYQIATRIDRARWIPRVALPEVATLDPWANRVSAEGVEVDRLPIGGDGPFHRRFLATLSYLRHLKPDILHLNRSLGSSWQGIVAGIAAGVRRIVVHEHFFGYFTGAADSLGGHRAVPTVPARFWPPKNLHVALLILSRRVSAALAHQIIVPSHVAREVSLKKYRYPAARTHTIHTGIDCGRFRLGPPDQEAARRELGIRRDVPVLLCVGRLEREKGQHILLQAMPFIRREAPGTVLLLAGDGRSRAELEEMSRELRHAGAVRFLGWREDIPRLLSVCDLSVVPSLWENFPVSILEAMAVGRAVVASRVGGVPEAVVHGETGVLVPAGDPEALASAIVQLLAHPEKRRAMGEAGKRRVEQRFSLSQMLSRIYAIWEM